MLVFFFKQKTAYEMRISDWSSDVCSSDLIASFPAMATRILPGIVNRFIQGRPDVRPLLTSSGSRFLIEWVTAQKSDLGIGLLGKDRPGVQLVKIMQEIGRAACRGREGQYV